MKVKSDFVTNSSSCSYIINLSATIMDEDENFTRFDKQLRDVTTLDCMKIIEGHLQYIYKLKGKHKVNFYLFLEDIYGDGWDGGDYTFAGEGYRFLGRSDLLKSVMPRSGTLIFQDGQLIFPEEWATECEQSEVIKKYIKE